MKGFNDFQYPLSELTGEIIGAAMEVHRHLGSGFPEFIYQRALALELQHRKIKYFREHSMDVFYKGEKIGTRQPDFLVEDKVIVELKATHQLEKHHLSQVLNYLKAYHLEIALLINFGASSLEFKRLVSYKTYH